MDDQRFADLRRTINTLRDEIRLGLDDGVVAEPGHQVLIEVDLQAAMSHVVQALLQAADCIHELQQEISNR